MVSKKHQTSVASEFAKLTKPLGSIGRTGIGPTMSGIAMDLLAFDFEQRHAVATTRNSVVSRLPVAEAKQQKSKKKKKAGTAKKVDVSAVEPTALTPMQIRIAEQKAKHEGSGKKAQ